MGKIGDEEADIHDKHKDREGRRVVRPWSQVSEEEEVWPL